MTEIKFSIPDWFLLIMVIFFWFWLALEVVQIIQKIILIRLRKRNEKLMEIMGGEKITIFKNKEYSADIDNRLKQ